MGRRPLVTRDEVLAAARKAFGERGYSATTLASIAAALGVSPAALLRHEPDKAALFAAAMAQEPTVPFPLAFLAVASTDDPAAVLRRMGETMVPFLEAKMGETVALWMHSRASGAETPFRLPFDPRSPDSPPRRVLALLEGYLRRAQAAGRIHLKDPHAAAVAFMATIHSYVFLKHVVQIVDSSLPLSRYLDTVIEMWTHGAIRPPRKGRPAIRRTEKKRSS